MATYMQTSGLLADNRSPDLQVHQDRFGPLPWAGGADRLIAAVKAAGLTGRGGAGFPTWRKLQAVAASGRAVVVANAAEGEPASAKDVTLVRRSPHLVLDGLQLAAQAVGAYRVYAFATGPSLAALSDALRQRAGWDRYPVELVPAPDTFVAGEESAVVSAVEGQPARPRDKLNRVIDSGVRKAPTLVQNVETLAGLALIARYGPQWWCGWGTPDEPGPVLVTVSGAVAAPGVYESAYGTRLGDLVGLAGGPSERLRAVLIGGYHGGWVRADPELVFSRAGLAPYGVSPGAGVVVGLPTSVCPVAESARILTYLAEQSAWQCGPCLNGLPALADAVRRLAHGVRDAGLTARVSHLAGLVTGRGACHHPDGAARFAASSMRTFTDDVAAHLEGRCLA